MLRSVLGWLRHFTPKLHSTNTAFYNGVRQKMENSDITSLDGFLNALSCGCSGCDFVPFYGAESFQYNGTSIRDSLENHFYKKEPIRLSRKSKPTIDNFKRIDNEWKHHLNRILIEWIDSKSSYDSTHNEVYKDDLLEVIEGYIGREPQCFLANISHESLELCNESIGFIGGGYAFFMHFSFSD